MKAYLRVHNGSNILYSQDEDTAILIGSWIHIKNLGYNVWFPPGKAYSKIPPLREKAVVNRISISKWLELVGPRGYLEIIEDMLHIRISSIARLLGFKFLHKIANMDNLQDFTEYDRNSEKPRMTIGVFDGCSSEGYRCPGKEDIKESHTGVSK